MSSKCFVKRLHDYEIAESHVFDLDLLGAAPLEDMFGPQNTLNDMRPLTSNHPHRIVGHVSASHPPSGMAM